MKPNFWMYATGNEQRATAMQMIFFGAEILKNAKIINEIDSLKKIVEELESGSTHPKDLNTNDFVLEYLVDCIRIMVFFENYMKAELIIKGYCIHVIDHNHPDFKSLAKEQKSRPIRLEEINNIEKFYLDKDSKIFYHKALKETTIQVKELIGHENYRSIYGFEHQMIDLIKRFNLYRNKLHMHSTVEISLSRPFLSDIEYLNNFVDKKLDEILKK